jgi:hypothetical protein
LKVGSV